MDTIQKDRGLFFRRLHDRMNEPAPQPDRVATSFGVVHVMPERYRQGQGQGPPVSKPTPAVLSKPVPPKPKVASVSHRPWILYGAIALVLLALLGSGGILLWGSKAPQSSPVAPPAVVPSSVAPPTTPVAPPPSSAPVVSPKPFEGEPRPGKDTDSDGLSDVEEQMFGSMPRLPDTDVDGFLDGNEVFHGYAPASLDPTTLLDLGMVRSTTDSSVFPIRFLLPTNWSMTSDPARGVLTVTVYSSESVLLRFRQKATKEQGLAAWLSATEDTVSVASTVQYGKTKRVMFPFATSRDQRTAYVDLGEVVLEATYRLQGKETVEYLQTFQMLVGSLERPTAL